MPMKRRGKFYLSAGVMLAIGTLMGLSACAPSDALAPSEIIQASPSPRSNALIPRREFFADPTYSSVKLSPNGQQVAFVKPSNGVKNIWVGPADDFEAAIPLTAFKRPARNFTWSADGRFLLIMEDWLLREMNQLWSVDVTTGHAKNLTHDPAIRTTLIKTSKKHPNKALIGLNERDARYQDVFLIDLQSGDREEIFRNEGRFIEFRGDEDLNVSLGVRGNDDGSSSYVRLGETDQIELMTIPLDALRSTKVMSYNKDGVFTLFDSGNSEYANLVKLDSAAGKRTLLAEAKDADIIAVFNDKKSKTLWATLEDPASPKWTVRSPEAEAEFAALETTFGTSFSIAGQPDEKRLLILKSSNSAPQSYHWWDRDAMTATLIVSAYPNLESFTLGQRQPVMIPTRDGLSMPSYLTLPPGTAVNADGFPTQPIPLIVSIHGGPWLRSVSHFSPGTAVDYWMADRGYASLSINYRGSVGFGKSFTSAGDKQWAGDMHNDVIDSVDWAIENEITVRDKVAAYGRSYGGYASLTSLTFSPDRFQCAVAIAGPSNLNRLMADMPAWWRYQWPQWVHRVGNPFDPVDAADLKSRSPITHVADIKGRLLLVATGKDPRVLDRQSETMVAAMEALDKPVTYLLYEDEGHGNYPAEVTTSMRAVTEHFLADCFGNTAEPFGTDLQRSDMEVKTGADLIPSLSEALQATGTKRFSKPHIIGD